MYAAMILFSVAGIFYHYRISSALRFAKGQCQTFKATVDQQPRKAARVEIRLPDAPAATSAASEALSRRSWSAGPPFAE